MKISIRNIKNRRVVMSKEFKNRGVEVRVKEGKLEILEPGKELVTWTPFYLDKHYVTLNK